MMSIGHTYNEPLSFLQRLVEYMEYVDLLKTAAQQEDPVGRLQYIAAFAVSSVSCNWNRIGKPFNPLLGETYEFENDNFRVVCEQVSHHPPVSAFHAQSKEFEFYGSISPKLKFWGKTAEITPEGVLTVELLKWGECYTWSNVNCNVHNVVVGKIWIEQCGIMEIISHNTGHKAILNFKSNGWCSKDINRVEGFIFDKQKSKQLFLYGIWSEHLKSTDINSFEEFSNENANKFKIGDVKASGTENSGNQLPNTPKKIMAKFQSFKMGSSMFKSMAFGEPDEDEIEDAEDEITFSPIDIEIPNSITLWTIKPRHENVKESKENGTFEFTDFTRKLNEIDPEIRHKLCRTDSRFRPDVRRLEQNDLDGSTDERSRLEDKQRESKSFRKRKKLQWKPRWFELKNHPYKKQEEWFFTRTYWNREFKDDPNIF